MLPNTGLHTGLACVASVPVRAKCCVSRACEDSGRAKFGARAKPKGAGRGGATPSPPPFLFYSRPNFARPGSFALHSRQILALRSIARERLLRRLIQGFSASTAPLPEVWRRILYFVYLQTNSNTKPARVPDPTTSLR